MKVLLLIAALITVGCDGLSYDLESVSLGTADAGPTDTGGADQGPRDLGADADSPDASPDDLTSTDMSTDAADAADAADIGPDGGDMGVVSKCEVPQLLDPDRCNPTESGVCPGDGFCTLAVAAAPPPELLCVMRSLEGTGDVGTPCTAVADCAEGRTCVDWGLQEADPRPKACARFCEIETGIGCEAGEFCTTASSQPPLEGIGYCTPTCDPYDLEACPTGQTCNIDYNFPVGTCEAHFRCVNVEGSAAEGDDCGPGRLVASCAEDLVCYEVQFADYRCVVPCQSDADCNGTTCLQAQGDWQLRYCEQQL